MKLRLAMAGETSGATVLTIASMVRETVGVKKNPRARVAVDAAAYSFIPNAVSHAKGSPDAAHWIVNNERTAWRDEIAAHFPTSAASQSASALAGDSVQKSFCGMRLKL